MEIKFPISYQLGRHAGDLAQGVQGNPVAGIAPAFGDLVVSGRPLRCPEPLARALWVVAWDESQLESGPLHYDRLLLEVEKWK